jgi:hypothetical protein
MPFEVNETGWGEFEVSMNIFFHDLEEEPILLFHQLKLYPPGPPQPLTTKKVSLCIVHPSIDRSHLMMFLCNLACCIREIW